MDCIFCKIATHEISKDFIYEDGEIMVFQDIHPIKEKHLLIIPKKHYVDFMQLNDDKLMVKIKNKIQGLVEENKLTNSGFRIVVNGGGAQAVDHLHFHLTGPWGRAADL